MGATEERALGLDSVTQDLTAAVITHRCQLMYGALEAIEGVGLTGRDHLKGEVVIVAADFTASHGVLLGSGQPGAALEEEWPSGAAFASLP
jgi:hypothetical protein